MSLSKTESRETFVRVYNKLQTTGYTQEQQGKIGEKTSERVWFETILQTDET